MVETEFRVGQRVSMINAGRGPQIGTVQYVGAVEGHGGTWVGVDWDNGEGKHDGSVNDVRYFEAKGAVSGSLVRPRSLSPGVSLLEALSLRYKTGAAPDSEQDDMYVMSVRQQRVAVELVGKAEVEERQGHLENLKVATLIYAAVCSAGPQGQLRAACPKINELDLTGNLLPDWDEVARICEELPELQMLDLSSSRITLSPVSVLPAISNLTTLVLNSCALKWKQVDILKASLPCIEELSLCRNDMQTIEVDANELYVRGFESLRILNLDENQFDSWQELLKLSRLKSLEQLNVNGNKLPEIFYPDSSSKSDNAHAIDEGGRASLTPFSTLRCLLLGGNQISDWPSVDALDQFPSLQEVRLSDNPITDSGNGMAARFMIVARIGKLTSLNGSQVKPRERRDSEIRYVRQLLTNMQMPSVGDILKCHPRFEHLRVLHDIPLDLQRGGAIGSTQKMSSSLLSVSLVCVASSVGEKAPVVKKLPSSTTVGRLRVVCESLFKLKSSSQHLFYSDPESPLPISLDNDMETLADIGIAPGASILVDEMQA
ncbi:hypothetical protein M758_1G036700 [Ceratodon purpureus]|nr:hypothetical protein M758_1G036700 [Ceratodon purpureus]